MGSRQQVLLVLAALGLVACEAAPRRMAWRVRFEDPAVRARTVAIEVRVVAGSCGGGGRVLFSDFLDPMSGRGTRRPGVLAPGAYSLEGHARDASCRRIASYCTTERLPQPDGTAIELLLQERPAEAICPVEMCRDGICGDERMPDAGPAPGRDTGPPPHADAGPCPTPLGGGGGSGGLGDDCIDGDDCLSGICLDEGDDHCTNTCGSDAECAPGWTCQSVDPSDCDPGCPPGARLCTCPDPRSERCNGVDDDCNGRVDDGADVCGLGSCACGRCQCAPGTLDCLDSGCVDPRTDARHCGACGNGCAPGWACIEGSCACTATLCGTTCTNVATDEANCGMCGRACGVGLDCLGGTCVCSGTSCAGACVDTATDESHCGACGATCPPGTTCCGGVCADTRADEANCGFCGRACGLTGWGCCGGDCVNHQSDRLHCGGCFVGCPSGLCSMGVCS